MQLPEQLRRSPDSSLNGRLDVFGSSLVCVSPWCILVHFPCLVAGLGSLQLCFHCSSLCVQQPRHLNSELGVLATAAAASYLRCGSSPLFFRRLPNSSLIGGLQSVSFQQQLPAGPSDSVVLRQQQQGPLAALGDSVSSS